MKVKPEVKDVFLIVETEMDLSFLFLFFFFSSLRLQQKFCLQPLGILEIFT